MFPVCDLYQVPHSDYQRQVVLQDSSESSFNNDAFKSAVFQRLFAINVPARSKDAVLSLVSKLQTVLEGIILQGASGSFSECPIEAVNLVGQYQKDTAIAGPGELFAEMVVTLKSLPTVSSLHSLGLKIVSDMMQNYPAEEYSYAVDGCKLVISAKHATVTIHLAALPQQATKVPDSNAAVDLIPAQVLEASGRLIDEAQWFGAHASTSNIKGLVRLLIDLRGRHPSLRVLNDPALDLLAHYCVTATADGAILSIEGAFRRFLELLAMGILLRDAWPTTEMFSFQDADVSARMAASASALELLCQISQQKFVDALSHSGV